MKGHHVAPSTHHVPLRAGSGSNRVITTSLWATLTLTLLVAGVILSVPNLPVGLVFVFLSMVAGVCATHAFHGGHFTRSGHQPTHVSPRGT